MAQEDEVVTVSVKTEMTLETETNNRMQVRMENAMQELDGEAKVMSPSPKVAVVVEEVLIIVVEVVVVAAEIVLEDSLTEADKEAGTRKGLENLHLRRVPMAMVRVTKLGRVEVKKVAASAKVKRSIHKNRKVNTIAIWSYSRFQPTPTPSPANILHTGDLDAIKQSLAFLTGGSNSSSPFPSSPGINSQQTSSMGSFGMGSGLEAMQGYLQQASQLTGAGDGAGTFAGYSGERTQQAAGGGGDDGLEEDIVVEGAKGKQGNAFQSRVIEEVKQAIRPYFSSRQITKDEYKEILKKCVPKVTHSGEINPKKISHLVTAYVKKYQAGRGK
nr:hypothetical protein BaRGS_002139 [Batillaria attramentaria]